MEKMDSPSNPLSDRESAGESGVSLTPWRKEHSRIHDASGEMILLCAPNLPYAQAEANLTLAAAAPELRDALEWALNRLANVENESPLAHQYCLNDCVYKKARAALAKAKQEKKDG
jgi:hypothetical protein